MHFQCVLTLLSASADTCTNTHCIARIKKLIVFTTYLTIRVSSKGKKHVKSPKDDIGLNKLEVVELSKELHSTHSALVHLRDV